MTRTQANISISCFLNRKAIIAKYSGSIRAQAIKEKKMETTVGENKTENQEDKSEYR